MGSMFSRLGGAQPQLDVAPPAPPTQDNAAVPAANKLSGGLRKAATYIRSTLGITASASGLVATAALINGLYQRHYEPQQKIDALTVLGPDTDLKDVQSFNHCITDHLLPAGIPGTPALIGNPYSIGYYDPSIPKSYWIAYCKDLVCGFLTHDLMNLVEHDLQGWRSAHAFHIALWPMVASLGAGALAVVIPAALNLGAKVLEARATQSNTRANHVDPENPDQPEPLPIVAAEPALRARIEKIQKLARQVPAVLLGQSGLGLLASAGTWIYAASTGKRANLSSNDQFTHSYDVCTSHDPLTAIPSRVAAYRASRVESLTYDEVCQIAAWAAPAAIVTATTAFTALKLTQRWLTARDQAHTVPLGSQDAAALEAAGL